ncbi:MAG: hypothetical protein K0U86_21435 [Planctomycetes bacterium]|nr:hypothetical protein [Planctomycetota bacterium]MCH9727469.1 hypothetical protein [Planctomycetota bacterium]MCH9775974.1 hypothetical protein [Planctomycetota bacterium]MCH9793417.1 hypothetical protein [Planctomycetota bacterium]
MIWFRYFAGKREINQPSWLWIQFRKALVLLLLVAVFFLVPHGLNAWRSKSLVETIRSHGGIVSVPRPSMCFNGYCVSLPSKLSAVAGTIHSIELENSEEYPINDEFIDSLGYQPDLIDLFLWTEKLPAGITDQGLAKLTKYPLRCLTIPGGPVTDSGCNVLGKIPTLDLLGLHDIAFTGENFHCASKMKNLKDLHLSNSKVTDAGLKNIASIPNLTRLSLSDNCINGVGLHHLTKSKKLSGLTLDNSKIKADTLNHLVKIQSLRYLSLRGESFDDSHVLQVPNVNQLEYLVLSDSQVTDQGVIPLTRMENLEQLFLTNTKVTDAGIKNLTQSESLMKLDLSNTLITDQVKESLLNIPQLHKVNVSGTKLSEATIQSLRENGIEVMTSQPGTLR